MKYSKLFLTIISVVLIFSCTKQRTTSGEFILMAQLNHIKYDLILWEAWPEGQHI